MRIKSGVFAEVFLSLFFLMAGTAFAQATAFNFQGRLNDGGTAANGNYDLRFKLFDAMTGGGQVGQTFDRFNVPLKDGVFSAILDFGPNAFVEGEPRYLELALRPAGSPNAYVVLGGRQPILSVPYSVRSIYTSFAGLATSAQSATNATTAQNSNNLGGAAASEFVRRNVQNTGDLKMSGNVEIGGNAVQPLSSNGFVKAMLVVEGGVIVRCFNGVTNSSTGNCGFSLTIAGFGIVRINFGFNVSNRFVAVTPEYAPVGASNNNAGANYRVFNSTSVEVFTFEADSNDTREARFTLIMF